MTSKAAFPSHSFSLEGCNLQNSIYSPHRNSFHPWQLWMRAFGDTSSLFSGEREPVSQELLHAIFESLALHYAIFRPRLLNNVFQCMTVCSLKVIRPIQRVVPSVQEVLCPVAASEDEALHR